MPLFVHLDALLGVCSCNRCNFIFSTMAFILDTRMFPINAMSCNYIDLKKTDLKSF